MNLYRYTLPKRGESFTPLLEAENVRIVRIVSSVTPDTKEYRQEEDEWVVLIEGSAVLEVRGTRHVLRRGDTLFLPAETPHRVLETEKGTLWLAVHILPRNPR